MGLSFFLRNRFWHGGERLPREVPTLDKWPSVVGIVPARDEAATIDACVRALMTQDYAGDFSIIVVDDASTDGTSDIVETTIEKNRDTTNQNDDFTDATHTIHRAETMAAAPLLDD
jgi:cellulose synthase/poly-beta-1,6-N-acetylglucosamine synthase-like glycosyltransferase